MQTWLEVAQSSRRSASLLVSRDEFRSCLSRAYYAAYSKVAHVLAATPGVAFPAGREGPNHPGPAGTGGIRRLIETHMPGMNEDQRIKLSELIGRLYTLRCDADYHPSTTVVARDARAAISMMNDVFYSF
jgi:hypothetical protein